LSRIIDPTEGEATVYGRVGSLLEVGTGFHPELTGRENIYLSGALLGMKRAEVRRRFDEIVEFAGVQKFLDTPCKHYSSGMYTRLGFAVAAHLDTEILLVDEVLAVGDVEFQRKCIEKMGKVSQGGRTIILVSHDLGVIRRLVHKCIWIDASRLVLNGPPIDVTDAYLKPSIQAVSASGCAVRFDGAGRDIWFSEARLAAIGGSTSLSMGDSALLSFELQSKEDCADKPVCLAVGLRTEDGAPVSYMVDTDSGFRLAHGVGRSCRVSVRLADLRLYPGLYFIRLWAGSHNGLETYDDRQDCLVLNVADTGRLSQRRLLRSQGVFFMQPEWRICV
jgi:lipopolysaccharide transport system ATP-binding protein